MAKNRILFLSLLFLCLLSACGGGTFGTGLGLGMAGGTSGTGIGHSYGSGGSGKTVGSILFRGKLFWSDGQAIKGASIRVLTSEGSFSTESDSNGAFYTSMTRAPQGNVTIEVTAKGVNATTVFSFFQYYNKDKPTYFYIANDGRISIRRQSERGL